MKSRTVSLFKRGYNFETFMWLFTRLSALAMYLCAFIGLVGAHHGRPHPDELG